MPESRGSLSLTICLSLSICKRYFITAAVSRWQAGLRFSLAQLLTIDRRLLNAAPNFPNPEDAWLR